MSAENQGGPRRGHFRRRGPAGGRSFMNGAANNSRAVGYTDAGEIVVARITEFVQLVRANGFQAGIGETLDALRVTGWCGAVESERLRWCLRALLCGNAEEWRRFDEHNKANKQPHTNLRSSRVQAAAGAALAASAAGPPPAFAPNAAPQPTLRRYAARPSV